MSIIKIKYYKPPLFYRTGHLSTIGVYFLRKIPKPNYKRVRIDTYDNDFIDIDTIYTGKKKLLILAHGLEGDSASQYIANAAEYCKDKWDIIAMNYRGCSGEMNLLPTMYHSGFTTDLHMLVEKYGPYYEEVSIVGFSLGGNIVLKYISDGIYPIAPNLRSAVSISAPTDLSGSAQQIMKWDNHFYEERFLISLKAKIKEKAAKFPTKIDASDLGSIKTVKDFDDRFTGPIHGFKDAEDYYQKCHSKQFLNRITIPTLLINALDDPFLSKTCHPFEVAKDHSQFHFIPLRYGGHIGFPTSKKQTLNEILFKKFINNPDLFINLSMSNQLEL